MRLEGLFGNFDDDDCAGRAISFAEFAAVAVLTRELDATAHFLRLRSFHERVLPGCRLGEQPLDDFP